jgi:hypothetical protein
MRLLSSCWLQPASGKHAGCRLRRLKCHITVFGGTGFLDRRVVRHLRESGAALRIASRHPGWTEGNGVELIAADAHDERAVENRRCRRRRRGQRGRPVRRARKRDVPSGARGSGRPGRERSAPGRGQAAGAPVRVPLRPRTSTRE